MQDFLKNRRRFMTALAGTGAAFGLGRAQAGASGGDEELFFPGDEPAHKVIYQLNHGDVEYQTHVLNSMTAMIGKYGGNVKIAVACFAKGIHLLAKEPMSEVDEEIYARVEGFATNYDVEWIACGNTMDTVGYSADDIREFARIEQVGAAALMEYQEDGYAYISW
ncbi:DsrE family protein [Guyparkeria halopsychrophila]|uniref:DsrE family protein n=1 Tax=Guyparkeria halopsychrophila TaxID=3139421 RepID=UPI0037C7FDE8